jgi:hypothetical protein
LRVGETYRHDMRIDFAALRPAEVADYFRRDL